MEYEDSASLEAKAVKDFDKVQFCPVLLIPWHNL
jgi:hypothetical protein